jgi:hypothetical protein
MSDRHDRQRVQPTIEGRARLLAAVDAVGAPHSVDPGTLGEFAELTVVRGRAHANAVFPEVAAHLAEPCAPCDDDLRELLALAAEPDPPLQPASPSPRPSTAPQLPALPSPSQAEGWEGVSRDESGIYAADLPDVRADEAAARRQRLRRWRDWLLVAAAVSILLIGLSLVGMAYLASQQPAPRLDLTPASAPPSAGRASPSRSGDRRFCPGSHPIKGNRTSMIYHLPGDEFYDQTQPEDCFTAPSDAEAAGFRRSQR